MQPSIKLAWGYDVPRLQPSTAKPAQARHVTPAPQRRLLAGKAWVRRAMGVRYSGVTAWRLARRENVIKKQREQASEDTDGRRGLQPPGDVFGDSFG